MKRSGGRRKRRRKRMVLSSLAAGITAVLYDVTSDELKTSDKSVLILVSQSHDPGPPANHTTWDNQKAGL